MFNTLFFFLFKLKLKKARSPDEKHTSQHVCSLMFRNGTAVENRCGLLRWPHRWVTFPDAAANTDMPVNFHPQQRSLRPFHAVGELGVGWDLLLLCHAECLHGRIRAEGRGFFPPLVFNLIRLNSAGCSSLVQSACCWAERSGKWRSVSGLRLSFLTTRPLRVTEWTRAKYSQTLGQWHGRSVCMCVICGRQVHMNTFQFKLVQIC